LLADDTHSTVILSPTDVTPGDEVYEPPLMLYEPPVMLIGYVPIFTPLTVIGAEIIVVLKAALFAGTKLNAFTYSVVTVNVPDVVPIVKTAFTAVWNALDEVTLTVTTSPALTVPALAVNVPPLTLYVPPVMLIGTGSVFPATVILLEVNAVEMGRPVNGVNTNGETVVLPVVTLNTPVVVLMVNVTSVSVLPLADEVCSTITVSFGFTVPLADVNAPPLILY
jgi:hypothetical protein